MTLSVSTIPAQSARLSSLLSIPQYDAALRSKENIQNYVTLSTWRCLCLLFNRGYNKILNLVWFSAGLFKISVINIVIGSITVRLLTGVRVQLMSDYTIRLHFTDFKISKNYSR